MFRKLDTAKKLVSLLCLALSLMGSFALEGASVPRNKQPQSLTAERIIGMFTSLPVAEIKSLVEDGTLDVHAKYPFSYKSKDSKKMLTENMSMLILLASLPKDPAFPIDDRCQIAQFLLDKGANWKDASPDGYCVPIAVAKEGLIELVQLLLDHPTNPVPIDYCPPTGVRNTMLLAAIEDGHLELVKDLVARGADIHSPVLGRTPWMYARINNQLEIMNFLEELGAKTYRLLQLEPHPTFAFDAHYFSLKDLATQDQDDGSEAKPIYWLPEKIAAIEKMIQAADSGDMASLKEVLEVDNTLINTMVPNHKDGSYYNVLGVAITREDCEMISYLLSKGARWDQELDFGTGGMGYIPITCLAASNPGVINCFLEAGMPIDHVFGDTTLLYRAAQLGYTDKVEFLLNHGAKLQKTEAAAELQEIEVAFKAAEDGHLDVVKLLCERDSLLTKRALVREDGYVSLLQTAIRARQERVVLHLLLSGAEFTVGDGGTCRELVEARRAGNQRIVRLVEGEMKKRATDQEAKRGPKSDRAQALRQAQAESKRLWQDVAALQEQKKQLDERAERLQSAAALLRPKPQAKPAQDAAGMQASGWIDRKTGVPTTLEELLAKPYHNQTSRSQNSEQASEETQKKKKKKNKKKKKVAQEDDGGPAQEDRESEPAEAQEDDGAAWEKWGAWEEGIAQAGRELRAEEARDRAAVAATKRALEQAELNRRERERKQKEEQATRNRKYQESCDLVQALRAVVPGNKSTHELARPLVSKGYVLVEEHEKKYGHLYDQVYGALFNSAGRQRRGKAAGSASAGSGRQPNVKNTGAKQQHHGAGKKANKPKKKSHIPRQWVPTKPLPKPAPSVYDNLLYGAGYEDAGQPKQQAKNYVLEQDASGVQDGGEVLDASGAQDASGVQDGGASNYYDAQANYDQGGAYRKITYGEDTLWVNMRHILDGDEHGGGHFNNPNKSGFQDWLRNNFGDRIGRALQNLDYRGPDAQGRDCIVGVFAPEQAGEVPVPFKGRIREIKAYIVENENDEEIVIPDDNGNENVSILATVYPITQSYYNSFLRASLMPEEKDDCNPDFQAQDHDEQELDLNSRYADAQVPGDEPYESVWD